MHVRRTLFLVLLVALTALAVSASAFAKPDAKQAAHTSKVQNKSQLPVVPSVAAPDTTIPDGPALNLLIRRTLLTLNDANLSGNYTVMRDLADPGFQTANDAARLAEIFAGLRKRKIDFAPILFFDPKLVRQPEITTNGMLHLSGFLPTRPEQINFDLLFAKTSDRWRLFGIAVNTSVAQAAEPPDHPEAGEKKSEAKKPKK